MPFMGVNQAGPKLFDNVVGLGEGQSVFGPDLSLDVVLELDAVEEFHGDKYRCIGAADPVEVIDRGDVRMRKFLLAAGLALQRDKGLGVFLEVVVQEFYRHMRLFVPGLGLEQIQRLVNLAHAAHAEDLQELEALLDDRTDIIVAGQVADG